MQYPTQHFITFTKWLISQSTNRMLLLAFSVQFNLPHIRILYLSSTSFRLANRRNPLLKMAPSRICFLLLVALLALGSHAQKKCVDVPINPAALDQAVNSTFGCDSTGLTIKRSFKLMKWGLSYTPGHKYSCPAEIVVAYRKKNRPAMIYYRPRTGPEAFRTIAPAEYRKYKNFETPNWPCHKVKVPVQSLHVWRNRKLFVRLITEAIQGIEGIRKQDCAGPNEKYYLFDQKFSWTEVNERARKQWLATTAVTYLSSLAFSNFICVSF